MNIVLRSILIHFLLLLQVFSPLLHAHAGHAYIDEGFHVPGLELVVLDSNQQACNMTSQLTGSECIIFSVASGIKSQDDTADQPEFTKIHPIRLFQGQTSIHSEVNYSPQAALKIPQFFYSPSSPRAPPVY